MRAATTYFSILAISLTAFLQSSNAQCTWQTVLADGYEYQTVCPDLIPGTTIRKLIISK